MSRYLSLASEVLPRQAQVVICGAGTVANSVAYHLVNNGWNDVLVLEKERIGSGTSHFGSGTLGLFKPPEERRLITYSIQLYRRLQEMGYNIGLKQCGSLNLAQTKDRMISLRRQVAYHQATGLHCQVLGRDELKKLHPYLRTEDLEGGVWVPEDAVADPKEVCAALAKLAKAGGARYVENCRVERVVTEDGRVKGVETSGGGVLCEFLVNCAGMWARELGLSCRPRVRVPACPAEHFYVTTGAATPPLDDDALLPCLRDYDAHVYARQWGGGFMVGGFEPEAKPAFGGGGVPEDWRRQLPEDWAHFRPLWERAMHRLPLLETLPDPQLTNSPDNFTPDGKWILGEAPEVGNYFVAVGMNGNSLQGAGGIGRAVAEWMAEGESSADLLPFSVQRFLDLHNNGRYLQQRTREVVGRHYQLLYPLQSEYKYARGLRCSPLYSVLRARGGVFGTRMGYERPLYFDTTSKDPQMPPGTFFKPLFLDFLRDEYVACNEGVGLIDMSSFSKVEVKSKGGEALAFLQRLCSEDADLAVGGVAHTGMLNERGGYENDCLLVRQGEGSFLLVSPTSQQTRVMEWLRRHRPPDRSVGVADLTSMYTVLNVVGPRAPALLAELSDSTAVALLQPFTSRRLSVGYASEVTCLAMTHTGAAGFCLLVPSEYALHVYGRLVAAGADFGARDVGCLTQRFMRLERFIPFWGEELTGRVTPYEAGGGHRVRLGKEGFVGQGALRGQHRRGVAQLLALLVLEDLEADKHVWPWGGEPVYRDGRFVGAVTSAGYGFSLERLVCLVFVSRPDAAPVTPEYVLDPAARYEVDVAGQRFRARPHLRSPIKAAPHGPAHMPLSDT